MFYGCFLIFHLVYEEEAMLSFPISLYFPFWLAMKIAIFRHSFFKIFIHCFGMKPHRYTHKLIEETKDNSSSRGSLPRGPYHVYKTKNSTRTQWNSFSEGLTVVML